MNYYKRHIGDYLKKTAHLSLLEHGIYGRLLDVYYTREGAIPQDQAARLIGARSKDECAALDVVLNEFFQLIDGEWHHDRCDEEIGKLSADAANSRANGKKGGRPKKNKTQEDSEKNPVGFETGTQTEPRNNLTPLTITPLKDNPPVVPPDGETPPAKPTDRKTTFSAWIKSLPDPDNAIAPDHAVFGYAERVGIPSDFLSLAWLAFCRRYANNRKRYVGWPKVFQRAVEENWMGVWAINAEGDYFLTTVGKQLKRDFESEGSTA